MKPFVSLLVVVVAFPLTAGAVELYTFVDPCNLIVVDTDAGTSTNLGPLGEFPYWSLEAMDHGPDGLLYATLEVGCFTHGNAHLIGTIDPETLEVNILGDLGPLGFGDVDAIAFSPDGRLFGISVATTELIEIDPATGTATAVGSLGLEEPTFVGAIEFLPDGTLVGIDMIYGGGQAPCKYLKIDTTTGAATFAGYVGFTGIEGMSLGLDGHLFALANSMEWWLDAILVRVDPVTGAGTQQQVLDIPGPRDALARAPGVLNPDNGHRYERFDQTMSWHDAGAYCEGLNGYLATITSRMEDDFVYDRLASFSPNEMVWLGATDELLEGAWGWQTGEVWDYANWAGGEPNNCSGIEHYLVYFTPHDPLGRAGFWNDLGIGEGGGCGCHGCDEEWYPMSFICEWDAAPKMEVEIDIKPGSCPNPLNVKSGGVLPVAVLGTADFDVTYIDPETITLHGIPPLRFGFEDVSTPFEGLADSCGGCTLQGADSFLDMTFKFDKNAVVEALGAVQDGGCVKIPLTGNLRDEFGGDSIHGADSVRIIRKKKEETLLFFDDFEKDDFEEKWISGSECGPNTITNVDGRIQATENCNYIETLELFTGNLKIEVDVEKVGNQDHSCWDFYVELASIHATGAIRFDYAGVDGVGIGYIWDTCGDQFVMDPAAPNKGRAVLTYSEPSLRFYFENTDGDVLATHEVPVGSLGASRIRIWLAAHPDTPRYIDNVSVYQLDGGAPECEPTAGAEYILSGGADPSAGIFVDDYLRVYVNGDLITELTQGGHCCPPADPVHFIASTGDELRVEAQDANECYSLDPLFLQKNDGTCLMQLTEGIDGPDCGNEPPEQIFFDETFVLP
jgi:hypothetical protein